MSLGGEFCQLNEHDIPTQHGTVSTGLSPPHSPRVAINSAIDGRSPSDQKACLEQTLVEDVEDDASRAASIADHSSPVRSSHHAEYQQVGKVLLPEKQSVDGRDRTGEDTGNGIALPLSPVSNTSMNELDCDEEEGVDLLSEAGADNDDVLKSGSEPAVDEENNRQHSSQYTVSLSSSLELCSSHRSEGVNVVIDGGAREQGMPHPQHNITADIKMKFCVPDTESLSQELSDASNTSADDIITNSSDYIAGGLPPAESSGIQGVEADDGSAIHEQQEQIGLPTQGLECDGADDYLQVMPLKANDSFLGSTSSLCGDSTDGERRDSPGPEGCCENSSSSSLDSPPLCAGQIVPPAGTNNNETAEPARVQGYSSDESSPCTTASADDESSCPTDILDASDGLDDMAAAEQHICHSSTALTIPQSEGIGFVEVEDTACHELPDTSSSHTVPVTARSLSESQVVCEFSPHMEMLQANSQILSPRDSFALIPTKRNITPLVPEDYQPDLMTSIAEEINPAEQPNADGVIEGTSLRVTSQIPASSKECKQQQQDAQQETSTRDEARSSYGIDVDIDMDTSGCLLVPENEAHSEPGAEHLPCGITASETTFSSSAACLRQRTVTTQTKLDCGKVVASYHTATTAASLSCYARCSDIEASPGDVSVLEVELDGELRGETIALTLDDELCNADFSSQSEHRTEVLNVLHGPPVGTSGTVSSSDCEMSDQRNGVPEAHSRWFLVNKPTTHPRRRTGLSKRVKCQPLHKPTS